MNVPLRVRAVIESLFWGFLFERNDKKNVFSIPLYTKNITLYNFFSVLTPSYKNGDFSMRSFVDGALLVKNLQFSDRLTF